MRRLALPALPALAVAAVLLVSACSPSEQDFKKEGEQYLESSEVATVVGTQLSDANCEEPASKAVGTVYACTANGADGSVWDFEIEITGDRELTVQDGAPRA